MQVVDRFFLAFKRTGYEFGSVPASHARQLRLRSSQSNQPLSGCLGEKGKWEDYRASLLY